MQSISFDHYEIKTEVNEGMAEGKLQIIRKLKSYMYKQCIEQRWKHKEILSLFTFRCKTVIYKVGMIVTNSLENLWKEKNLTMINLSTSLRNIKND